MATAAAQKQEQEQARADTLARLLTGDAKERLNRIALVKPDKVRGPRPCGLAPDAEQTDTDSVQ